MKKMKTSLFTLLCLAIIFSLAIPISSPAEASLATIYVDDDPADYPAADFTRIQDAVTAASAGDTIIVYPGTYTENVDVNKDHLSIQSENGAEVTIVEAANLEDPVFHVTADHVTISGFTVKGQGGMMGPYPGKQTGIWLDGVEQCLIRDNIPTSISDSTNLAGICLSRASNNTLSNNTALGCHFAIDLFSGCHNNSLIDNIILDSDTGIRLFRDSSNNTLNNNMMSNNRFNFWASGEPNNVDTSNKANGKPIQYLVGKDGLVIDSSWDVGYLGLVNCTNIVVKDLTLTDNGQGLLIADSIGVTVEGVNVSNNFHGIDLQDSSGNTLINSTISYNVAGIHIRDSSYNKLASNSVLNNSEGLLFISSSNNVLTNNTFDSNHRIGRFLSGEGGSNNNHIYLNNFINNLGGIESVDSTNIWQSPAEITYTYNGNTYTNYLGNYWSDYGTYLPPVGHSDPGDQWEDEPLAYDGDINTYARVYVASIDTSWLELLAPSGKTTQGIRFWGSGGPLRVDIYYDGNWHCLRDWSWGISSALGNEWVELTYPSKIVEKARIKFHGRVLRGWSHLHEFQFKTAPADYSGSDADGDGIGDSPYSIDSDKDNYPLMEPFENYVIRPAPSPTVDPVADAEPDYAYVHSGSVIHFDGSNSYDPDGTIVSYEWDFGDGETATGVTADHRFRGAMNEPKDYDVTLTVQDNMGAIDTDAVTITVTPLEKTVPLSSESGEVFAQMTAFYNWVQVIEGEDIYVVSKIDFEGERFRNYLLLVWDEYNFAVAFPAWTWGTPLGILMPVSETFTYPFGTYRDWADTVGNEYFEGLAVCSGDRMELHAFSVELAIPELEMRLSWESAYCYFAPSSHEVFPSTGPILWSIIGSSAELRIYDSEGRVTGLVNGEVKEEIPYSTYGENIVMILPSYDSYTYEVEGTDEGSYRLGVASVEDGESTTFTAIDIPTVPGAVHQYTIDWDALSQGEKGVTVQVDSDGDGEFEDTFTSDDELTGGEFILQTATTVDFDPDTLNLKSKGKYVTVYIELPLGYDVSQIDVSSIMLNEVIPALTKPTEIGDYDGDGIPDLMVKFDRVAVQEILTAGDQVEITISGEVAGIDFEGRGNIRVMGD